jgi:hypothetical protein
MMKSSNFTTRETSLCKSEIVKVMEETIMQRDNVKMELFCSELFGCTILFEPDNDSCEGDWN